MSAQAPFDPAPHYAPRPVPAKLALVAKLLVVVGIVSLGVGLSQDALRARSAVLVNLVYFLGLSAGGVMISGALVLAKGRWGRPVKRIAESFVLFLPVVWVLLVIFLLTGGLDLYEWHTHPESLHAHKAIWLTSTFFIFRVLFFSGVITLLGLLVLRNSLRPDLGVASEKLEGQHPAWWGRITAGWQGEAAEVEAGQHKQMVTSVFLAMAFAYGLSVLVFDLVMSLAPHWYSNMFGAWFFCSSFWLGMVGTTLFTIGNRHWLGIDKAVTIDVFHDFGKMIFGFSCLWAYMNFAQLLPIWYGNMTEEIGFLIVRLYMEPWQSLSVTVGALCFFIPFVTLMSRGIKKMPLGLSIILVLIAVGIWLERYLMAMPSIWMEATLPLGLIELGITLGFLGAFLVVVTTFLSQVPPIPVTDPFMQPNPEDIHVHSLDAAHSH
jgi:hypothetical protein